MLFVRGHFDNFNSYGILASELCEALLSLGVELRLMFQPGSNYQDESYNSFTHPLEKYKIPYNSEP